MPCRGWSLLGIAAKARQLGIFVADRQNRSVNMPASCNGEMVRLVMRSARHEADEAEPANVRNLGRRVGRYGQPDTIWERIGLCLPIA